jgi:hypothetical protein
MYGEGEGANGMYGQGDGLSRTDRSSVSLHVQGDPERRTWDIQEQEPAGKDGKSGVQLVVKASRITGKPTHTDIL